MEIGTLIAGVLTVAVFSFLYGDNPIYRAAESLLIGLSIGYAVVIAWNAAVIGQLWGPLTSGERFDLLIPAALALLLLARVNPKWGRWSRVPLAILIGAGAGVAIPAMLEARTVSQVLATIGPLWGDAGIDFGRIVLVVGVLCTLAYFYFTKPQTGALGQVSKIGVLFLMLFFGTTFGYTVMSRMSLLIGRLDFLLVEFLKVL